MMKTKETEHADKFLLLPQNVKELQDMWEFVFFKKEVISNIPNICRFGEQQLRNEKNTFFKKCKYF